MLSEEPVFAKATPPFLPAEQRRPPFVPTFRNYIRLGTSTLTHTRKVDLGRLQKVCQVNFNYVHCFDWSEMTSLTVIVFSLSLHSAVPSPRTFLGSTGGRYEISLYEVSFDTPAPTPAPVNAPGPGYGYDYLDCYHDDVENRIMGEFVESLSSMTPEVCRCCRASTSLASPCLEGARLL